MKEYVVRLCFRCTVFFIGLAAYFIVPDYFDLIVTKSIETQWELAGLSATQVVENLSAHYNIIWIYVVWGILMMSMLAQMIPDNKRITMGKPKPNSKVSGSRKISLLHRLAKVNIFIFLPPLQ